MLVKPATATATTAGVWRRAITSCAVGASRLAHVSRTLALAGVIAGTSLSPASAQLPRPITGTASVTTSGNYARLILKLNEDIESDVSVAGSILLIRFKKPVRIPIERLQEAAPDYIGSVRRDPDGSAIRLALARKVTINTMVAGERIFIDLMPDNWTGPPPGLPQDVIRELAERARAAERALRLQLAAGQGKPIPSIRVRASPQPTFVRFSFEIPDGVGVQSTLTDRALSLTFNTKLDFDLADAKVSAPPNVVSISERADSPTSAIDIALVGEADVHTFREDKTYIIDIGFQPKGASLVGQPPALPPAAAKPAVAVKPDPKPLAEPGAEAPKPAPKPAAALEVPVQEAKPAILAAVSIAPAVSPPPAAVVVPPPAAPTLLSEPPSPAASADRAAAASVDVKRSSDGLRMNFKFATSSPAALFRRGDIMWLVLDNTAQIDLAPIRLEGTSLISNVSRVDIDGGQAIRFRLARPQLASLASNDQNDGREWSLNFADTRETSSSPLAAVRNILDRSQASVSVALAKPGAVHRLVDPDAGDILSVVTALPPSQGFIRRQDFVEFSFLESIHGVVVQANADEVSVSLGSDKVTLTRPGGLTLSASDAVPQRASSVARPIFDVGQWRQDQVADFIKRLDTLIDLVAAAEPIDRLNARMDLARFYLARGMFYEAKGVADLALLDARPGQENPVALVVRAVANVLIHRPDETDKDLKNPLLGPGYDADLWKGLAFAERGEWVKARDKFRVANVAVAALPLDLQRIAVMQGLRAALEVKDFGGASMRGSELDLLGFPPEMKYPAMLLSGWLDEALGRDKDALSKYQTIIAMDARSASAEARIREIALRMKRGEMKPEEAVRELEVVSVTWRGDRMEVLALQMLSRLYSELGRYSESFTAARLATQQQAGSDAAREVQDAASMLFSEIFLGAKGDGLPPVDALGLFYEFRELTPIGRRGDEMIRRLADRLVAVDLLEQAAELLQYQVDHRIEGAARAHVASRLAMVYLLSRKPERAIAALRTTRIADLSGELRQQRLLLEARAQSDIGRRDLALDIISQIAGPEAVRLRSDIYWSARRWREASEQIELYYGDRWRDFKPLNTLEKSDIIRAVVGYALAEDTLGLARFREKFAPLMNAPADKIAFDTATKPASSTSSEFAAIAKMAASIDTLDGFMREMKTRFPDTQARINPPVADPITTGELPVISNVRKIAAQ